MIWNILLHGKSTEKIRGISNVNTAGRTEEFLLRKFRCETWLYSFSHGTHGTLSTLW